MRIGRYEFDINESDLILDNGACYQLITREVGSVFYRTAPKVSKAMFKRLLKEKIIYTNEELAKLASTKYVSKDCVLYGFNFKEKSK